jgi:Zn-finger nucleic acid-binding protein
LNCPNCGAPMRLEENRDCLICDFCGSLHFPDPNEDGVRVLGVTAAERCPVCAVPLVSASVAGVRMSYCEKCRGMLFEMGNFVGVVEELRARGDRSPAPPHPIEPRELDRRLTCPRCQQPMDTHPYGGPGNIVIDSCSACELDWLDYGELRRVASAPEGFHPPEETWDEE